ncbi:glycosyl transferase, group 1 family protein [Metarhizium album ARSEF 1941]|uniref:Glycosyl transferase, group 1 family protein n=1 Tax=Metarhizium album (strain ARSEF 1941) TaxID=1081103 RepID=A0A0B2WU17_METAS|nr:glycosyl transferase, group 1 family protein [Metarhizium album ARSEF 1941]KHN97553.1 glycosyl transferase, group 1 family protein [Metarhizium album ARSEF 1941]
MAISHLGLSAVGWHLMIDSWWDLIAKEELNSFGVFLGSLANPPTAAQHRLLSQWDILVLDPFQDGVTDALKTCQPISKHVLGRINVDVLTKHCHSGGKAENTIEKLNVVTEALERHLLVGYRGVLLAGFREHFQTAVMNELSSYIRKLGLDVWLELSCPEYLAEEEARAIDMEHIKGIVYRNGTIRRDGDRQNFFQMAAMRTVMRAVAAQRVAHGPALVMWETVDNDKEMQFAVVVRAYNWCTYNSALCWVGHADALFNAESARTRSMTAKPLGALMWLKNEANMSAHDTWRANDKIAITSSASRDAICDSISAFLPGLSSRLRLLPPIVDAHQVPVPRPQGTPVPSARRDPFLNPSSAKTSALSVEPRDRSVDLDVDLDLGLDLDSVGLGCFQLGHKAGFADFAQIRVNQSGLADLDLLTRLGPDELGTVCSQIETLCNDPDLSPKTLNAVHDLVHLLRTCAPDNEQDARIKIFSGLHSGFQTDSGTQYWGLYTLEPSDCITLHLSNKAKDRTATILHTFLSSRQLTCAECLLAEQTLARRTGRLDEAWQLGARIVNDLERLSPAEALLLTRQLHSSTVSSEFLAKIRDCLDYQLLDKPSLTQQRALGSVDYLSGAISAENLVESRLSWLAGKGCCTPDRAEAVSLFAEVENRLYSVLIQRETSALEELSRGIQELVQSGPVDAGVDIFALAVFCAFRKLALDEVYLEVLDRNVYPNHGADQAGCFAENFALGSRCDSFFDATPRAIGRIIASRYREYYMKYQPPLRDEMFTELPTTYASMQVDLDPNVGKEKVALAYQITFFAIFAVPALIDVMLLTTIGRGLYLSTYMSSEQKTMATTALMLALLMSGSFGAWICSGGSYYFYANTFPAMNMFVLTRCVAGFATTIVAAIGGFIVITFVQRLEAALIFLYYFVMLSTYLLVLNALSIYQLPGSSFLSGRTVIFYCMPIMFISPVVSMFAGRDIVVYLPVLSCFLIALLLGARNIISQWSSWYLNIPFVTDAEVIGWYRRGTNATAANLASLDDKDVMPLARAAIHAAVLKESNRFYLSRASPDLLVRKLAEGYQSTMFLMRWYCRHRRTPLPLPYSTTWNLTLKAGMENLTNMQKGLKLHSAFLHWRATGRDIWSGLLYFVVALLDKWVALLTGGGLVGLSAANSEEFRLGIGFGLCYYLVGAVSLDIVSQPLWTAANEKSKKPISSLESLREINIEEAQARRSLYWRSLCKFFFLHIWGAAVFMALMWVFQSSRDNTITFLGYIVAYSGLLWYQFNKIFCGTRSAAALAVGAFVGLPTGLVLHKTGPGFGYSGLICLGVATWASCLWSFFYTNLGWPTFLKSGLMSEKSVEKHDVESPNVTYSVSALEPFPELSQSSVCKLFESSRNLPEDERYFLDPAEHPGQRVIDLLSPHRMLRAPEILRAAFPAAGELLQAAVENWKSGKIVVELVSSHHLSPSDIDIRSVSRHLGQVLHIFVILDSDYVHDEGTAKIYRHWKVISEAIIRATAQHLLGLSYHDSILAELLVVDHFHHVEISLPIGVKRQLEASPAERTRVMREGNQTLLRYVLLGVDVEREWDLLPKHIRRFLLRRCDGSSEPLSNDEEVWLQQRTSSRGSPGNIDWHIARCKLGVALTHAILNYAHNLEAEGYSESCHAGSEGHDIIVSSGGELSNTRLPSLIKPVSSRILQKVNLCIKFLVLSLTADPEYQRELDFVIQSKPGSLRWPLVFFLNAIWSYCKFLQNVLVPLVLFHGREPVARIQKHIKGMTTVLERRKVITETLSGPSTWFWTVGADGSLRVSQYNGRHDEEPSDVQKLVAVNTYTDKLVLQQREVYNKGVVASTYHYEYRDGESRLPLQRRCLSGDRTGEVVEYDRRGYITSGSAMRGVNRVTWKFWYRKNAKHEDELLWAEYTFPHITIKVLWSMPPRNPQKLLEHWIPFSTVTEATFIHGENVYHASWGFEHKSHPEVSVTLNGNPIVAPPMIKEDWFHVLQKPEKCSFQSENPLLSFSSIKTNPLSRLLGFNVKRYPIPTSVARTQLWKAWKDGREVDAISARWLDEKLLRSDYIMRPYWRMRDFGRLEGAKKYLDAQADSIMARVDLDPSISSWVHIAYKIADLYSFGPGGDARINTRKLESQLHDTPEELHVLAMDTSTWPNDPGGVSACRRDMVNDLKTIKWHVVAESANDYGVPRFQIERNVQSLTILPLWGLDFLNPTHGVLEGKLDSAVVQRSQMTRTADITRNFLPILSSLVKCSRTVDLNRQHIEEATRALVDLNTYFEKTRNWNDVWQHPVVKEKWRELWLTETLEGAFNISQWWDFEKPSLKQLDSALDLWCRYLFIFSLPVPEEIPDVFQASHHFTGATYGIVCKAKRNCTLHIWDHCISFREFSTFMSSAVSYDAPFVNSSLISLTHLSCVLLEHHADVVLPCCDYFNPGWEVELGTAEGVVEHRRTFERKIDPVVNGICNMEKFEPIKTIKTDQPTVVMLSHVQYAKDIKNAIMATDIIVNKWGIRDYRLHVYGDQERAASIATECQELIASKNLQDYCILKGLGNPSVVLQDAWLFLNSSISEGLPLAMGEAALTGVPVVCTDVGASYCVVTDRETGDRFSEVVPPNDSESLARAQISVMGLLGRWAEYADDPPGAEVPVLGYPMPTPEQVKRISERIYAKTEQRRALGMRGRQNVLNNFSSERYLREHEQMLWIGKYRSRSHRTRMVATGSSTPTSLPLTWSSRLTPESWNSLCSKENLSRAGWRSIASSTYSVREIFSQREKQHV